VAAGLTLLAGVAGCTTGGMYRQSAPIAALPQGAEGNWIGTDGVAISTLQAGIFSSRSAQTGEALTQGSYTYKDTQTIELSFYSIKKGIATQAACLLVSTTQMNCTLADGTQFTLLRYQGVS
jgi:hypothetical protein